MLYENEITDGLRMYNPLSNRKGEDDSTVLLHKRSVASEKEVISKKNSKDTTKLLKLKVIP